MSTITADPSAIFPNCPTFGYQPTPDYLVKIIARESGRERRDRKWSRPLITIQSSPTGNQSQDDIEEIIHFWHAMGGMSTAFRFKEWSDYKSCRLKEAPTAFDMPLIATADSPPRYQLAKEYVVGSIIQLREIYRPVGASVLIANDSGAVQTDWSLDESTGIVTKGGTFAGTPATWGGEFYIWARFNAALAPTISDFQIMNIDIQIKELRNGD